MKLILICDEGEMKKVEDFIQEPVNEFMSRMEKMIGKGFGATFELQKKGGGE